MSAELFCDYWSLSLPFCGYSVNFQCQAYNQKQCEPVMSGSTPAGSGIPSALGTLSLSIRKVNLLREVGRM